jgi:hypothetical protein
MEETFVEVRDRLLRRVGEEVEIQLAQARTSIEQAFYCGELRAIADTRELEAVDDFSLLLGNLGHIELCRPDLDNDLTFVDPRLRILMHCPSAPPTTRDGARSPTAYTARFRRLTPGDGNP